MKELLQILDNNNIKYLHSKYGYTDDSIIISGNHYQLEIYYNNGYVSDLQKVPYTWGRMGSTTLNDIIDDLKNFLGINIIGSQLSIF